MSQPDPRVDDLLAQMAAQGIQIETLTQQAEANRVRADEMQGKFDAASAELDKLKKIRADESSESPAKLKEQIKALVNENEKLKKARNDAMSPERLREAVKARVALERAAMSVLDPSVRVDELDDRAVMVTTLDSLYGPGKDKNEKGEARSDEYLSALFNSGVEAHNAGKAGLARVMEAVNDQQSKTDERKDSRSAREKFLESQNNAWKEL